MGVNYEVEKKVIKNLLLTCNKPVNVETIEVLYEQSTGNKIPYLHLGFANVENLLLSMHDAIISRYSHDGSLILSGRVDNSTEHIKKFVDHQKSTRKKLVPAKRKGYSKYFQNNNSWSNPITQNSSQKLMKLEIQQRLKALINIHPEGLRAHEIESYYLKEYPSRKKDLDFKLEGYNSLEDFIMSCDPDTFYVKGIRRERIFYPKVPTDMYVKESSHLNTKTSIKDKLQNSIDFFRFNKISDVENFGVKAGEQFLTYNLELFNYFTNVPVEIGEVYSPLNFYLLIQGEPYTEALHKLSADMRTFYIEKNNMNCWKLDSVDVVYEQPVVIFHKMDKHLYRGIITGIRGIDKAEVYLIDLGANYIVDRDNLLHLHRNFFDLPAQAINAKLHNTTYSSLRSFNIKEVSSRMLKLIHSKKSLYAVVRFVNVQNYFLSVELTDGNSSNESINKILIKEGYLILSGNGSLDIPNGSVKAKEESTILNEVSRKPHRSSPIKQEIQIEDTTSKPVRHRDDSSDGKGGAFSVDSKEMRQNINNSSNSSNSNTFLRQDAKKLSTSDGPKLGKKSEEGESKKCVFLKGVYTNQNNESNSSIEKTNSFPKEELVQNNLEEALDNLRKVLYSVRAVKEEMLLNLRQDPSVKSNFIHISTIEATVITLEADLESFSTAYENKNLCQES